jgi:hypothetical protein
MSADAPPDRWLAVLDAVSVSPVRRAVKPAALPPEPPETFLATAKGQVARVPALGPLLGIEPPKGPPPPPRRPPPRPPMPQRRPPGAAAPEVPEKTEDPPPTTDTQTEDSEGEIENGKRNASQLATE